jgi:hypothetical protein
MLQCVLAWPSMAPLDRVVRIGVVGGGRAIARGVAGSCRGPSGRRGDGELGEVEVAVRARNGTATTTGERRIGEGLEADRR